MQMFMNARLHIHTDSTFAEIDQSHANRTLSLKQPLPSTWPVSYSLHYDEHPCTKKTSEVYGGGPNG